MRIRLSIVNVVRNAVHATIDYVATRPSEVEMGSLAVSGNVALLNLPDDVWTVAIDISPKEHNQELVRLLKVSGTPIWETDNPAATVTVTDTDIAVAVIVGRLRSAPAVHIPDEQIPKLAEPPRGVLLHHGNQGFIYHSLFADPYDRFFRLSHPVLRSETEEHAETWERFNGQPRRVDDPKKIGTFFHLEYGDERAGPRLLVSMYLPRPGTREALDFIVFLSPTTAIPNRFPVDRPPFRSKYPYSLSKGGSQEYPRLSQAYLFNGNHLVHQLLAAESNAVLVMPVAPYGDWSIFQHPGSLYRLLRECSLFLHREMLTTRFHTMRPSLTEFARAGGSVRQATAMGAGVGSGQFGNFGPRPAVFRVAIAAYSSGCIPLYALMNGGAGLDPRTYPPAQFGQDDPGFDTVFREIWDIDGAHGRYHGYEAFESALSVWYMRDGHRRFRLYHSSYTGGSRDSMAKAPLATLRTGRELRRSANVIDNGSALWAKEEHADDSRWSCVRFADGYLSSAAPSDARPYWLNSDAHHFLPKIAFGHAAHLFAGPKAPPR